MLRPTTFAIFIALATAAACGKGDVEGPADEHRGDPRTRFEARLAAAAERFRAVPPGGDAPRDPELTPVAEALTGGRYSEAVALAEKLVVPGRPVGRERYYLALALHKQQRYAEALPHFEAVLDQAPRFPKSESVFYFYAWALYWLGRVAEAEAAFTTAATFQPDERDVWFGRGVCRLDRGATEAAEADLRRSLGLAEAAQAPWDVAKARARLADVALARDDAALARQELEAAVTLHPELAELWHKLARVCARQGDDEAAARARAEAERRAGR